VWVNSGSTVPTSGAQLGDTWTPDVFLAKLNPQGSLLWLLGAGGSKADEAMDVVVDRTVADGAAYVCGRFSSPTATFGRDAGEAAVRITTRGGYDAFVVKVASDGGVAWGESVGGVDDDEATGVALDGLAAPYAAGAFRGVATFGGTTTTNASTTTVLTALYSYDDVFVMKLSATGTVEHAMRSGGNGGDRAAKLALATNAGDGGQVREWVRVRVRVRAKAKVRVRASVSVSVRARVRAKVRVRVEHFQYWLSNRALHLTRAHTRTNGARGAKRALCTLTRPRITPALSPQPRQ